MKQSEYMSIINKLFNKHIGVNKHILDSYCYNDHRACNLIVGFKKDVGGTWTKVLELSSCKRNWK